MEISSIKTAPSPEAPPKADKSEKSEQESFGKVMSSIAKETQPKPDEKTSEAEDAIGNEQAVEAKPTKANRNDEALPVEMALMAMRTEPTADLQDVPPEQPCGLREIASPELNQAQAPPQTAVPIPQSNMAQTEFNDEPLLRDIMAQHEASPAQDAATAKAEKPASIADMPHEPHSPQATTATEQPRQSQDTNGNGSQDKNGFAQRDYFEAIGQVKLRLQSKTAETETPTDATLLEQQVARGEFVSTPTVTSLEQGMDIERTLTQTADGIEAAIESGKSEYVIKLKPEGLGEITVRLTQGENGSILVSLTAQSEKTLALIKDGITALQTQLTPLGARLEDVRAENSRQPQEQGYDERESGSAPHEQQRRQNENAPAFTITSENEEETQNI